MSAITPREVKVCLHLDNVCDGISHCPLRDDERLCHLECPDSCTCQHGLAFTCSGAFPASRYPQLRFLDGNGSGIPVEDLTENKALMYLNLASSGISGIPDIDLPNLLTLDLSFNKIGNFRAEILLGMPNLRDLSLRSNPVTFPFYAGNQMTLPNLQRLDLSLVWTFDINGNSLTKLGMYNLKILNLSYTGVERVNNGGFHSLQDLRVLDLRGCPMKEFDLGAFSGVQRLEELYGTNPKLCCPSTVENNVKLAVCSVPTDSQTTTCDSLLQCNSYRLILIIFASLAIAGNMGSFVYRVFLNREESSHSCGVVVTHLCVSDLLMGIYLVIIGVADSLYGSRYFLTSETWRSSGACKAAGFLSLLSSEVSAFFICILTVDRLAAIRYTRSGLRFRKASAEFICWMTWFAGVFLACVPLIESHWKFYGETGTCLPLPTNSKSFDGRDFSFGVLIMLNFVLFLIIAVGQVLNYLCSMISV